jgi:phage gp36-like protein
MYCEEEDLYSKIEKAKIIDYAKDSDDTAEEYKERIAKIIEDTSGEINGYLAKQYNLPLSPIPIQIKNACVEMSIYKILCRKGIDKNSPESIWLTLYEGAISFLKDVRDGKNDLGIITGIYSSLPSNYEYKSERRHFDKRFWNGF